MEAHTPIPSERTFGCEFEWCVGFRWEDVKPSNPDTGEITVSSVPNKTRDDMPVHVPSSKYSSAYNYVIADICKTLKDHGLPVQESTNPQGEMSPRGHILAPYQGWTVKLDDTIRTPKDSEFHWCPVEITSPAQVASDGAFISINRVVSLLTSKYRILVNSSCGFHVHVGQGADFLEVGALGRVAGILWAADPLLGCLHPPERRFNYWSQSIRERSTLALGTSDLIDHHPIFSGCINHTKGKVRPTTSENDLLHAVKARVKKQSIEGSSDTSPSDAPTYSTRRREGPRIPFPKYTAEEEARLKKIAEGGRFSILDPKARTDPGVFHGVKEILSYSAPCTISWLLEASVKPNYNFEGYSCLRVSNPSSRKRTVEFREAAGTTSGRWAETWARICVGIYEWAIHAPVAEYLAVLDNCDQAAKGGEYDVIDLLDQIGLSDESAIAEERVKNQTLWE